MRCICVNVERRNGCIGLCNSELQKTQYFDGLSCHCIKRHLDSSLRGWAAAVNIDESLLSVWCARCQHVLLTVLLDLLH